MNAKASLLLVFDGGDGDCEVKKGGEGDGDKE